LVGGLSQLHVVSSRFDFATGVFDRDASADHLHGRRYCGYSSYPLNSIRLDADRQFAASRIRPCFNLTM